MSCAPTRRRFIKQNALNAANIDDRRKKRHFAGRLLTSFRASPQAIRALTAIDLVAQNGPAARPRFRLLGKVRAAHWQSLNLKEHVRGPFVEGNAEAAARAVDATAIAAFLVFYSQATPNGVKVTVMLEELLALGHSGAEYDAWLIRINDGDQFGSGFVAVNPNSKIPALMAPV